MYTTKHYPYVVSQLYSTTSSYTSMKSLLQEGSLDGIVATKNCLIMIVRTISKDEPVGFNTFVVSKRRVPYSSPLKNHSCLRFSFFCVLLALFLRASWLFVIRQYLETLTF